jgi:hypothetical protein
MPILFIDNGNYVAALAGLLSVFVENMFEMTERYFFAVSVICRDRRGGQFFGKMYLFAPLPGGGMSQGGCRCLFNFREGGNTAF